MSVRIDRRKQRIQMAYTVNYKLLLPDVRRHPLSRSQPSFPPPQTGGSPALLPLTHDWIEAQKLNVCPRKSLPMKDLPSPY